MFHMWFQGWEPLALISGSWWGSSSPARNQSGLLNQKPKEWGPAVCGLALLPGDPNACSSLRTTGSELSKDIILTYAGA